MPTSKSSSRVEVSADIGDLIGKELITTVIEPEVIAFSKAIQPVIGSSLTPMEREILKLYLYKKLTKQL